MIEHDELKQLLVRVRAGDQKAAAEFCDKYRDIAAVVLARIRGTQVGRTVSASEQIQSGLVQVLTHLDKLIDDVSDLPKYLRAVARNKLRDRLTKLGSQKRDVGKEEYGDGALDSLRCDAPPPSEVIALAEEYEALRRLLSPEERTLVDARTAGLDWVAVGELLGCSPDTARKQFARLRDRLRDEYADPDTE